MPFLNQSLNTPPVPPAAAPSSYSEILARLTADKWQVVTEGPSGAQMRLPKKPRIASFIIGIILLVVYWPLGVLVLIAAVVEHAFFVKERTYFLNREAPRVPPAK